MGEIADALERVRKSDAISLPTPGPRLPRREDPDSETDALAGLDGLERRRAEQAESATAANAPSESPNQRQHTIPDDRRGGWEWRVSAVEPESATAVRFRHLAIKLRSAVEKSGRRSVLVTSALSNEGKTTVSVNLALALASIAPESRVALVDLDLRKGSVSRAVEYKPSVGIEAVLRGDQRLEAVRVSTNIASLDLYPVHALDTPAHQLLGSSVESVLHALSSRYDFVICDGPPGLPVPDVSLIAPHVGGCLVVSRAGMTRHSAFKELVSLLPVSSIFGVFLNDSALPRSGDPYRYYGAESDPQTSAEANATDEGENETRNVSKNEAPAE